MEKRKVLGHDTILLHGFSEKHFNENKCELTWNAYYEYHPNWKTCKNESFLSYSNCKILIPSGRASADTRESKPCHL